MKDVVDGIVSVFIIGIVLVALAGLILLVSYFGWLGFATWLAIVGIYFMLEALFEGRKLKRKNAAKPQSASAASP